MPLCLRSAKVRRTKPVEERTRKGCLAQPESFPEESRCQHSQAHYSGLKSKERRLCKQLSRATLSHEATSSASLPVPAAETEGRHVHSNNSLSSPYRTGALEPTSTKCKKLNHKGKGNSNKTSLPPPKTDVGSVQRKALTHGRNPHLLWQSAQVGALLSCCHRP